MKRFIVETTDISLGYVRFIDPRSVVTPWYMFGEEFDTPYSPIEIREVY